jgi:hypothetical protein
MRYKSTKKNKLRCPLLQLRGDTEVEKRGLQASAALIFPFCSGFRYSLILIPPAIDLSGPMNRHADYWEVTSTRVRK